MIMAAYLTGFLCMIDLIFFTAYSFSISHIRSYNSLRLLKKKVKVSEAIGALSKQILNNLLFNSFDQVDFNLKKKPSLAWEGFLATQISD